MLTHFQAEERNTMNSSGIRNLRRSGRLPGIVFGRNAENKMIHLSTIEFQKWLKQGESGIIGLQLEGKEPVSVLLEDLQRDPVTRDLIHVDFQLVQTHEIVRTKLPVKFKGTPVGTKQGGVVQIQCEFIEVESLPEHLPTSVEFDISGMNIGDSVYVGDFAFSPEVRVISAGNEFLVSVVKP
ncbi:50S ribosomal protein L25 [Paenibacillus nasutitermitis]|uniref:Large ribosomal subunit protein bL25 n=1 Tax=Paenibacillus nasutitermitis TaxID=1652958 RepID=A0A917E102_9BACL|nr:50S ribosomal protein L25 [Paenibacillus nasutitermitis]GGD91133.1 50S ribosomal protein L25 [Paenibacillus nasutitermitis]